MGKKIFIAVAVVVVVVAVGAYVARALEEVAALEDAQ